MMEQFGRNPWGEAQAFALLQFYCQTFHWTVSIFWMGKWTNGVWRSGSENISLQATVRDFARYKFLKSIILKKIWSYNLPRRQIRILQWNSMPHQEWMTSKRFFMQIWATEQIRWQYRGQRTSFAQWAGNVILTVSCMWHSQLFLVSAFLPTFYNADFFSKW